MWDFNFSKPLTPFLPVATLLWYWKFNAAFKNCRIQTGTWYSNEPKVRRHQERKELKRARGDDSNSCVGYPFAHWSTSPAGTARGALWWSPWLREGCRHAAARGGVWQHVAELPRSEALLAHVASRIGGIFWRDVTTCLNVVLAEMHLSNLVLPRLALYTVKSTPGKC